MSTFKDNKVAWGIAGAALLGVAALIIILALKHKKDDTPPSTNTKTNKSQPLPPSNPPNPVNPPQPQPPSPSLNTCFYTDCSLNCALCKGAHSMVDDLVCSQHLTQMECMNDTKNHCGLLTDSPDLMKCLPCYLQDPTRKLDGGQCEELLNAANDTRNECSDKYQQLYDANCSSKNDPIIHNNTSSCNKLNGMDCGDLYDAYVNKKIINGIDVKKCYDDETTAFYAPYVARKERVTPNECAKSELLHVPPCATVQSTSCQNTRY